MNYIHIGGDKFLTEPVLGKWGSYNDGIQNFNFSYLNICNMFQPVDTPQSKIFLKFF